MTNVRALLLLLLLLRHLRSPKNSVQGGNMSGRMSQSSFMRAMKDLQFQGDAKLIWVVC